jgi:2-oxoglutarate ferredoxin oxidoreductase subunit beta
MSGEQGKGEAPVPLENKMSIAPSQPLQVLKPADYGTDQDVRWCPGCGDYSILAQIKKVLAKLNVDRAKTVFVSGIGCSSRFPYYMNTYGIHSIHGRAPTFATGLKLARPELNIWIATGDGDAMSIGGNHFMHVIRRNVDVKILLFNNRIYGLTKGQYSPTSEQGKKTKSTPMGAPDHPIRPLSIAIGAGATFAARAIDIDVKHLEYVLERAARHVGTAVVEIYQNCNIFNDGAFEYATDKSTKSDATLYLEHGKPLVFGKTGEKGIRMHAMNPEVVDLATVPKDDLLVHDEKAGPSHAFLLTRMRMPELPEPLGVLRAVEKERYVTSVRKQTQDSITKLGPGNVQALLDGPETWTVS